MCLRTESLWLEGPTIQMQDNCLLQFFKSTNCTASGVVLNPQSFRGSSWMIENSAGDGIAIEASTAYELRNIVIDTNGLTSGISFGNNSFGFIDSINVTTGSASTRGCLNLNLNARLTLTGNIILDTETFAIRFFQANGNLAVYPRGVVSITSSSTTLPVILMELATVVFRSDGNTTSFSITQSAASTAPVIDMVAGSTFKIRRTGTSMIVPTFAGNTTDALISANNLSSVLLNGGTTMSFTNAGGGSCLQCSNSSTCSLSFPGANAFDTTGTAIVLQSASSGSSTVTRINLSGLSLKCGDNAAGAATTQNDLGAGTPENCFYFSV
jgi:hypothetical protein